MSGREKPKVFLSHRGDEKIDARMLVTKLSAEGIDCWLDETGLQGSQDWASTIADAISKYDVLVVILTKLTSRDLGYMEEEIRIAKETGKTIFPVLAEDTTIPSVLKSHQAFNLIDFFNGNGHRELADLAYQIQCVKRRLVSFPDDASLSPNQPTPSFAEKFAKDINLFYGSETNDVVTTLEEISNYALLRKQPGLLFALGALAATHYLSPKFNRDEIYQKHLKSAHQAINSEDEQAKKEAEEEAVKKAEEEIARIVDQFQDRIIIILGELLGQFEVSIGELESLSFYWRTVQFQVLTVDYSWKVKWLKAKLERLEQVGAINEVKKLEEDIEELRDQDMKMVYKKALFLSQVRLHMQYQEHSNLDDVFVAEVEKYSQDVFGSSDPEEKHQEYILEAAKRIGEYYGEPNLQARIGVIIQRLEQIKSNTEDDEEYHYEKFLPDIKRQLRKNLKASAVTGNKVVSPCPS
jgi:hypothetical protein